jgi:hypothetical protein
MRLRTFITRVFMPFAILGALAGCGGGGSSTSNLQSSGAAPVTSITGVTPNDAQLSEYKPYTFSASAVDSTIGRSIASFVWNFGDGTGNITVSAVNSACSIQHDFQTAGGFNVLVTAKDDQGLAGTTASLSETVVSAPTPVTVLPTVPSGPTTLQVQIPGAVQFTFQFTATTTATGATIGPANVAFTVGDTSGTGYTQPLVGTITQSGSTFSVPVTFYANSSTGSRTATPTVTVTDSLGNNSARATFPVITIASTGVNHPPTVLITQPASTPTNAFTSKPVTLTFTLTDQDGDVVSYDVSWGDGTADSTGNTGAANTIQGVPVSLTHAFPDSFTSTSRTATVTVTANDGRTPNPLPFQTTVFDVTFNAYPTATILSPQASGTLPNPLPAGVPAPSSTTPEIVVIPIHGQLNFSGTGTLPGSQDPGLGYTWTFPNGSPSSSSLADPGQVFFDGVEGQLTPCLVTFTVTDAFGRNSSAATGANVNQFEKWVIVDGTHTQAFTLGFLYRQKSDNNGVTVLNQVQSQSDGLGATVQIYQDGTTSTWTVQSGNSATIDIPVRSDLPFYVQIPSTTTDSHNYLMRVPNAPTGVYSDPSLVTSSPLPAGSEGFGFAYPTATASPWWQPTLQVVTAEGFTPEGGSPQARFLAGEVFDNSAYPVLDMVIGASPVNSKWVDRLSVPLTAATPIQWEQDSNTIYGFSSVSAYQIAEWPIVPLTVDSFFVDGGSSGDTHSTVEGKPGDMGFNVNYPTYANSNTQPSTSFMVYKLQAFRAPSDPIDPFDLNAAGWNTPSCVSPLNPTHVAIGVPAFFENMLYQPLGSTALSGGLTGIAIPYQPTDVNRTPLASPFVTRNFDTTRSVFSYSEYLWSSVWVRPLVLNSAQLNFTSTLQGNLSAYPFFRFSEPTAWPQYVTSTPNPLPAILPDNSYFNLTASGGGKFNPATTPVGLNDATPAETGVGRFYWTAFTPSYNAELGAVISRTWLSVDGTMQPPTAFPNALPTDATSAIGFVPPQDTAVDKRGRNADGSLSGASSGGYRVLWYNPTVDTETPPMTVAPDFWVIEITTGATNAIPTGGTFDFMLPGNFPAPDPLNPGTQTQSATSPILTDARTFLPSGKSTLQTLPTPDTVAPGYCWFDVPLELRPAVGNSATITVFALKSVLSNNAPAGSRALNRPDWIDGIKTVTGEISIVGGNSNDVGFAHGISTKYPWDIVVVNGPATYVEP